MSICYQKSILKYALYFSNTSHKILIFEKKPWWKKTKKEKNLKFQ